MFVPFGQEDNKKAGRACLLFVMCDVGFRVDLCLQCRLITAEQDRDAGTVSAGEGIGMDDDTDAAGSFAIMRTMAIVMVFDHDQIAEAKTVDAEAFICLRILCHDVIVAVHHRRRPQTAAHQIRRYGGDDRLRIFVGRMQDEMVNAVRGERRTG